MSTPRDIDRLSQARTIEQLAAELAHILGSLEARVRLLEGDNAHEAWRTAAHGQLTRNTAGFEVRSRGPFRPRRPDGDWQGSYQN